MDVGLSHEKEYWDDSPLKPRRLFGGKKSGEYGKKYGFGECGRRSISSGIMEEERLWKNQEKVPDKNGISGHPFPPLPPFALLSHEAVKKRTILLEVLN
ncbi:hypothetical protein NPIL_355101 [Nephila pilipes]|uniref:Uncharacterized protein n=1 Tax=Nephila pilipes TaxID=299642 RepID=A0A8X6TD08_NEPPI|nr:hypothetical protein NPIL_355101 [Nephila pilipes]